ncbi:ThiF family adenylyltransferase [Corynebacterium sp. L4756]|uniref:ThiF family adenylyltransferase n=1 Tax=unclassified Corynebacterium TaxID=2624378 RepID=UPI00374D8BC0
MSTLTPREISRYRRQLSLAGFGPAAQDKLHDAHVAVIGAGGLGSPALLYLAGAGVGQITIFDADEVDISNLHRQVIHTTDRIGVNKAESARLALAALNPDITINVVEQRLDEHNIIDHLRGADVVLDGTDNFATRYNASWVCAVLGIPHVWASILGFDAQLTVFYADHGPIYEDLFPIPPALGSVPSCSQAGVLGPTVGVVGSAMALEAIKLITDVGTPLIGKIGYFTALEGTWEYIPLVGNPQVTEHVRQRGPTQGAEAFEEPPATNAESEESSIPEVDDIPENALVIDVRNPDEFEQFSIPGTVKFPLPRILDGETPEEIAHALAASRPVVLHCAGGIRSARAVEALNRRGFTEGLFSLRGGIDAWLDKQ